MERWSELKRRFASALKIIANRGAFLLLLILITFSSQILFSLNQIFNQNLQISFPKSRESVYKLLSRISDQTGYFFIYDSDYIDNKKVVKVKPGVYPLEEAVKIAVGNKEILLRTEGKHILLYKKTEFRLTSKPQIKSEFQISDSISNISDTTSFFNIEGTLIDKISGEPVVFATVGIKSLSIGTVSNLNGHFKLRLSDSIENSVISISHLGYETAEFPAHMLAGHNITYSLTQKVVPLQEVVVRVVDPQKTIREMLNKRALNYAHDPVLLTIFYREGVEFGKNINLTEAVLQIFKTGYRNTIESELVKLLKMRKISNPGVRDTLMAKVKSSIYSFQQLDLVKNLPDFLDPESIQLYNFHHSDITSIDGRRVYVISFKQKPEVYDALYMGELFIDADNLALIRAKFEMNPEFIDKAADVFVVKKDRALNVTPSKVSYDVDYKLYNGTYFINHIRGDIDFKIRKRWKFFNSALKVWFEIVNCKTDTGLTSTPSAQLLSGIKPFPANERIQTRDIFSEILFDYDPEFWGNFNVIMPEFQIIDLISNKIK